MLTNSDIGQLRKILGMDAMHVMNRALESIRFDGQCVHIGWIVADHPTGSKSARVRVDPMLTFVFWERHQAVSGWQPQDNLDEIKRYSGRFSSRARRLARETLHHIYREWDLDGAKPSPVLRAETAWDWLLSKTLEDLLKRSFKEAKGICVGPPFQPASAHRSGMLYALLDKQPAELLPDTNINGVAFFESESVRLCERACTSFAEATVFTLLRHFTEQTLAGERLSVPDNFSRTVAETLMIRHVERPTRWGYRREAGVLRREAVFTPVFEWCRRMSHQEHEGEPLTGRVCITAGNDVVNVLELMRPIRFENERGLGKLIMASTCDCYPIIERDEVRALGRYTHLRNHEAASRTCRPEETGRPEPHAGSVIEFRGRGNFSWWYRSERILDVKNGVPTVPVERISQQVFAQSFQQRFPGQDHTPAWSVVEAVASGGHGATVVISSEAEAEASRLFNSFAIRAANVTPALLQKLSTLDGGLMISPSGLLQGFGVILDGLAVEGLGDVGRGARFNSAVKYVRAFYDSQPAGTGLLIAVISQDGMVDLVPHDEQYPTARPHLGTTPSG